MGRVEAAAVNVKKVLEAAVGVKKVVEAAVKEMCRSSSESKVVEETGRSSSRSK